MTGDDLHLDVRIRDWVLIPVAIVTFCMGIMLQSLGILVRRPPKIHQHKIREGATLTRLGQFKRNAGVLPPDQFASRLAFFVEGDDAFLNQPKPEKSFLNSFMSPDFMASQLTESMLSFLPQMVFGAFIRYTFGGFTVCKVPFPLPQRFGSMLQSGIELASRDLDVTYVSALSWYVLNLFGYQGVYRLVLSSPNMSAGTQSTNSRSSATALSGIITDQVEMGWNQSIQGEKATLEKLVCKWDVPSAEDELLQVKFEEVYNQ
mmetsp:Transcript_19161/g.27777  ORF Transcript_19161/g.27777 Transcript_19161/m.27777 type:complete len:261 (-) Transcript_19161:551-1333(-)